MFKKMLIDRWHHENLICLNWSTMGPVNNDAVAVNPASSSSSTVISH
jgi:hypothetical protein